MKRIWFFLALLLLPGCWDQRVVEEMEFIISVGYDAAPNGQIKMTVSTPFLAGEGTPKASIYSTTCNTPREGREKMRLGAYGRLEAGKTQQILFGESLAKRGLLEYLEIFTRDPRDPVLARPIVVKGTAENFLKISTKWKNKGLPGFYMRRLLDNMAMSGNIPKQNVDHFLIDYYAAGSDPILPYMTVSSIAADTSGAAIFHHDRMVGILTTEETFLFLVLNGESPVHISPFVITHKPGEAKRKAIIRFTDSSCRKKISFKNGIPHVRFNVKFKALLDEWHIDHLLKNKNSRHIELAVARQIKHQLEHTMNKLKKANSDTLGIGNEIRAYHSRYWRSHDWERVYPKIKTSFDVKVEIQRFGVLQ